MRLHSSSARKSRYALIFLTLAMVTLWSASVIAVELTPAGSWVVTPPNTSVRGMDVNEDGSIVYIGGMTQKRLVRLELPSGDVTNVDLTTVHPQADVKSVAIDSLGRIWVPFTTPILAVYSPDLELETHFDLTPFGITNTEGAVVADNGDIYVTNRDNTKPGLFKFRLVDGTLQPVGDFGLMGWVPIKELRIPSFTPNGDLMMTSWTAGQVHLVRAGDGINSLFAEVPRAFQLDVDGEGRVYIVHYEKKDVALTILNPDGSVAGTWSAAQLGTQSDVSGVGVTKDGSKLFVLDQRTSQGGMVRAYNVTH